jgi:hypothetical protein
MRMRQDIRAEAGTGVAERFAPRVYSGTESDAFAWRDEQLGLIFRNMRLTVKVSRETIARRLATSTSCVDAFEAGAVGALPHGKETERIVRGYCELVRIDPEPILWRIRGHMQALASQPKLAAATARSRTTSSSRVVRSQPATGARAGNARPRRRRKRALFALTTPVALVAGLVYLAHVAPKPVYLAVALLPQPIEDAARAGLDYLAMLMAPQRDGLRWIEVGDPRVRKADKLQTTNR